MCIISPGAGAPHIVRLPETFLDANTPWSQESQGLPNSTTGNDRHVYTPTAPYAPTANAKRGQCGVVNYCITQLKAEGLGVYLGPVSRVIKKMKQSTCSLAVAMTREAFSSMSRALGKERKRPTTSTN